MITTTIKGLTGGPAMAARLAADGCFATVKHSYPMTGANHEYRTGKPVKVDVDGEVWEVSAVGYNGKLHCNTDTVARRIRN